MRVFKGNMVRIASQFNEHMINPSLAPTARRSAQIPPPQLVFGDVLFSGYLCFAVLTIFLISSDSFWHWFVIPVLACGVLIGVDLFTWIRIRSTLFDPRGILGLLGFHFFFLAPLLHVYWDHWVRYVATPDEWRGWLGGMAIVNFVGLVVYRLVRDVNRKELTRRTASYVWQINKNRFLPLAFLTLLTSFILQLLVYRQYGGILGYIDAFSISAEGGVDVFANQGWLFTVSECFPVVALMVYAVLSRDRLGLKSVSVLAFGFLVYCVVLLLFGGFRGSRSNIVWGVFWAAGIIHLWIRQIPRKLIPLGLACLITFMYIYGFYKSAGLEGVAAIQDASYRSDLADQSNRSYQTLLLSDLGRSDTQALLLYKLLPADRDYDFAWGRTYLGAALSVVPRAIWPDRPATKLKEGTEAQYGRGSYVEGGVLGISRSSLVYGLVGEAMLNFGVIIAPFFMGILGLVVRKVSSLMESLTQNDCRWLMVPFLVNLCFALLVNDSDVVLFFIIKNGGIPILILLLGTDRVPENKGQEVEEK